MKNSLAKTTAIGLSAFIYLSSHVIPNSLAQNNTNLINSSVNSPVSNSVLEQKVATYKKDISNCLDSFAKTNNTKEEVEGLFFDVSSILDKYEKLKDSLVSKDLEQVEADSAFSEKIIALYLKKAERQLVYSEYNTKRPSITSLENAVDLYKKAYSSLKKFEGQDFYLEPAKKIESGFSKLIQGYNNYVEFNKSDVLYNPDGKEVEFNPVAKLTELDQELKSKIIPIEELNVCKKSLNYYIASIKTATTSNDGPAALSNMVVGVKWLTTILSKDRALFVSYFSEYNTVAKPAMEIVGKNYSKDQMEEFKKFYGPLTSHYTLLTKSNK